MKICWDNLKDFYLSNEGNLKRNNTLYTEKESCARCGDPYMTLKNKPSDYCTISCALSGENHPQYGKKFSKSWRNKLSISARIRFSDNRNNPNYKGGVEKKGLPLFDTFSSQIDFADKTIFIYKDGLKLLQVKCTYCGKWFIPTIINVRARIAALNKDTSMRTCGEGRFYCSDGCKKSCPTFGQHKYPKEFKPATSREVQPELRQMVFERDDWTCQRCGETEAELHCHHITGVVQNPIESADVDNCITFCKKCHKSVHKQSGCKYYELRCEEVV